jgi:hypothetical protein
MSCHDEQHVLTDIDLKRAREEIELLNEERAIDRVRMTRYLEDVRGLRETLEARIQRDVEDKKPPYKNNKIRIETFQKIDTIPAIRYVYYDHEGLAKQYAALVDSYNELYDAHITALAKIDHLKRDNDSLKYDVAILLGDKSGIIKTRQEKYANRDPKRRRTTTNQPMTFSTTNQ